MSCLPAIRYQMASLLILMGLLIPRVAIPVEYAVVVNRDNEIEGNIEEIVRNIFLRERTLWQDGTKATPFKPSASQKDNEDEDDAVVAALLGMTLEEFHRHWASKKEREGVAEPRSASSPSMLAEYIRREKGAIGIMRMDDVAKAKDLVVIYVFSKDS